MSDAAKRTAEIERLDIQRLRGQRAEQRLNDLGELMRVRQEDYLASLVGNTKRAGEVDSATVWKLVALEDVMGDLTDDIGTGQLAIRKLKALNEQAGVDDDG